MPAYDCRAGWTLFPHIKDTSSRLCLLPHRDKQRKPALNRHTRTHSGGGVVISLRQVCQPRGRCRASGTLPAFNGRNVPSLVGHVTIQHEVTQRGRTTHEAFQSEPI